MCMRDDYLDVNESVSEDVTYSKRAADGARGEPPKCTLRPSVWEAYVYHDVLITFSRIKIVIMWNWNRDRKNRHLNSFQD